MRVTYAFVFYFAIFMVILSLALIFLCIPFFRKLFFKLLRSSGIGKNQYFIAARYIVVAVILIILFDAIFTYLTLKSSLQIQTKDMLVDDFELIKKTQQDDFLILYKKYRELYLAERNFLLTSSTLVIYFIFRRFVAIFGKLVDIEAQRELQMNEKQQGLASKGE